MVQISVVKSGMTPLTTSYRKIWASNALGLKDIFIYIYRKENEWIKMINYVDDALYFASEDKVREHFERILKNQFH